MKSEKTRGRPQDPEVQRKILEAVKMLGLGMTHRAISEKLELGLGSVCRAKKILKGQK